LKEILFSTYTGHMTLYDWLIEKLYMHIFSPRFETGWDNKITTFKSYMLYALLYSLIRSNNIFLQVYSAYTNVVLLIIGPENLNVVNLHHIFN